MSDRRSFSEIPAEMLRDHAVDARVDRIWERLAEDALPGRARRRAPALGVSLAIAACTFALGVFVGVRFSAREPLPLAALEAEPMAAAPRAALPERPAASLSHAYAALPESHTARRAPQARRVEPVEPSIEGEPPPPVVVAPRGPAEWQRLADDGQYGEALASLEASGGFDAALRDASAEQLMALVDVARATGQRDRAVVALRRVVGEHGSDPNAPVAAWMLGSELAKAGDPAAAEQAFAMYRALSPNGDFAEDALARQVDMAAEQGNLDHAKKLASQYLKEFPDGPRTLDIEARIAQWEREQKALPRVEEAAPAASGTPVSNGASASSGAPDASTSVR
jgi:hypothetical protein